MAHPYHLHREHQVSHRRVGPLLKEEPAGATQHASSNAFSKVTSKTAAESHDGVAGRKGVSRYARGGKVKGKGKHQTNIAIVVPHHPPPPPGGQPAGPPMGPPPMGGPGLPPPGGAPGMPPPGGPPGMPPGMPMRARGGKIDGEDTKANQKKWSNRAKSNSYARGGMTAGALTGEGRLEKAGHAKRK